MYRILLLPAIIMFAVVISPAESFESVELSATSYALSTPRELLEAYLSFHNEEICRGVDSIFIFNKNGVEILSRVEDEGRYKRLLKMFKSQFESGRMKIYVTASLPKKEESDRGDFLPPSLWENNKLYGLFYPRLLGSSTSINSDIPVLVISPEEIYRQRLLIFSEQTLDQGRLVKRYAADLSTLARIALDPTVEIDLRIYAKKVCLEHSESLNKQIGRLEKNLKYALPTGEDFEKSDYGSFSVPERELIPDLAALISDNAGNISGRVYSFIYPECHTVELDELRSPDLLESIRMLRKLNDNFRKKIVEISIE